ncbi:MAG: GIY-YIG nuclease family protein [Aquaticitalea sp.]
MSLVRFLEVPQLKPDSWKLGFFVTKMAHYLYILFSKLKKTFYVGESHDVIERLEKHNSHAYNPKSFTKITSDWEIALNYKCRTKEDALYLEKFIKRMKSKKFILRMLENPDILSDILNKK